MEKEIEKLMSKLDCSREEALDIIATDKAINQGADPFPQTEEQKKVTQKMLRTGTRKKKVPTVYKFEEGRQRKANPQKEAIIAEIAKYLTENGENDFQNVEITNKTRQIAFTIGDKSFELTLVEKRKK
jgi:hypothetical protein